MKQEIHVMRLDISRRMIIIIDNDTTKSKKLQSLP